MQTNLQKLQEIKANFEQIDQAYKTATANCCEKDETKEIIYNAISNVYRYIDYVSQDLYRYINAHSEGHLPPIKDAGKMQEALTALGLGNSFEIKKPVIYASTHNSKRGLTLEI